MAFLDVTAFQYSTAAIKSIAIPPEAVSYHRVFNDPFGPRSIMIDIGKLATLDVKALQITVDFSNCFAESLLPARAGNNFYFEFFVQTAPGSVVNSSQSRLVSHIRLGQKGGGNNLIPNYKIPAVVF